MNYFLAILLPPISLLIIGKPGQALLNIILTFCFWIPGILHALLVVHGFEADQRLAKFAKAITPDQSSNQSSNQSKDNPTNKYNRDYDDEQLRYG